MRFFSLLQRPAIWVAIALSISSFYPGFGKTIPASQFLMPDRSLQSQTRAWQFDPSRWQIDTATPLITIEGFPAPDQSTITLSVHPHRSVFVPGLQIQVVGKDGKIRSMPAPAMQVFAGSIVGDPHSDVLMIQTGNWLFTLVESPRFGNWLFAPAPAAGATAHSYTPFAIPAGAQLEFRCYVPPTDPMKDALLDPASLAAVDFSDLFIAPIAIETDSDFYRRMSKDTLKIARYVGALLQSVSRLYEKEVNVALQITWMRIWTEGAGEDPYTADGNVPQLLQQLTQYWRTHHLNVDRAITHLLTARRGGGVGGIAWRDHLCDPQWNFSVSAIDGGARFPVTRYVWDVMVVAHEMGHNFRARHTHDCWWNPPLDTCVTKDGTPPVADACFRSPIKPRPSEGSIMSYCHLINSQGVRLWFSPRVATVLRQAVVENATTCLRTPQLPFVSLLDPVGGQTISILEPLHINWTAAKTAKVILEYADHKMQSWHRIATVNADQRQYEWTIPEALTDSVIYIRIAASAMPQIADTSAPLQLIRPAVQWLSLLDSAELAIGDPYTLLWNSLLLDTVSIEFSADSMQSWSTVATNIPNSGYYPWSIPDAPTNTGFLRIYDPHHPQVADTNRYPFRIGTPYLSILEPNAQTIWIAGQQDTIRWDAGFLSFIRIELSTDDGTSWKRLKLGVKARQKRFVVQVPNTPTTQARVRLRNSKLSVVSDRFTIQTQPTNVPSDTEVQWVLSPNPVSEQLTLRIPRAGQYTIEIFTTAGQRIFRRAVTVPLAGSSVPIDLGEVTPGVYLLYVFSPEMATRQFLFVVQP